VGKCTAGSTLTKKLTSTQLPEPADLRGRHNKTDSMLIPPAMRFTVIQLLCFGLLAVQCVSRQAPLVGSFAPATKEFHAIVSPDAPIEIIGEGYAWSEGPVWIESEKMLLFSDVPANTVYQWKPGQALATPYLTPSGFTGEGNYSNEPGSNGLLLDAQGALVLCQHGNRQLARMASPITAPQPNYVTVADRYDGRRFNSPNDVAEWEGSFFFTDPPYGLPAQQNDTARELPFQGVFQVTPGGDVRLLIDSLTRPNGIAFFPDGNSFLVANSDPQKAMWYQYDWNGQQITRGRVFHNATPLVATQRGLPDGLKIDRNRNVFATGPGGIFVFDAAGQLLGTIRLTEAASNCALSADEKTLFITNDMRVLKITLRE